MQKSLLPLFLFLAAWIGLSVGIHTVMQNNTMGSDFYLFYHAGQNTFFDRTNPYSDESARLNQLAIFKRLSNPGEDQLGFAYPPYALLPVWPPLGLSFDWAQAVWTGFLLVSMVSTVETPDAMDLKVYFSVYDPKTDLAVLDIGAKGAQIALPQT